MNPGAWPYGLQTAASSSPGCCFKSCFRTCPGLTEQNPELGKARRFESITVGKAALGNSAPAGECGLNSDTVSHWATGFSCCFTVFIDFHPLFMGLF
jgi:hypothetical protein